MEPYSAGKVCYFALDGNHPVIARHRNAGGQALFVRDNSIVNGRGRNEEAFLPLTRGAADPRRIGDLPRGRTLAAVARRTPPMKIPRARWFRARAESFTADVDKVPLGFNMLDATVRPGCRRLPTIMSDALNAFWISVKDKFPHQKRTCVYSAAGDRRDCDLVRQGELLGNAFDHVVLYEDHYLRGRTEGEIMRFSAAGWRKGNRGESTRFTRVRIR